MTIQIASLAFTAGSTPLASHRQAQSRPRWRATVAKFFAVAALLFGAGCTTTTITPELVTEPPQTYTTVTVGDVSMKGDLWHHLVPHFREGLVRTLEESNAFATVMAGDGAAVPQQAIVVSGEITEVDEGSAAARWIIGFGAGRARAQGFFEIHDSTGKALARFSTRKAYSGGAGIGGASFVSMEQLLTKLGETTAQSVVRWTKGEPLEPPASEAN